MTNANQVTRDMNVTTIEAMRRLGVTYEGNHYLFKGERYDDFDKVMVLAYSTYDKNSVVVEAVRVDKADEHSARAKAVRVATVPFLPPDARYKLIDVVSFQSTLGTGFFNEFGSDWSNIFGTEAKSMNAKMTKSQEKVKDVLKTLAYRLGANAVIGVDFDFSTNTRDATTVAATGTAVFIENIDEVFM
jgi:uncharacterized protein YbjQ (UPF0145 family)